MIDDGNPLGLLAAVAAVLGAAAAVLRAALHSAPAPVPAPDAAERHMEGVNAGLVAAVPALAIALDRVTTRYVHADAINQLPRHQHSAIEFVTSDAGYPQLTFNTLRLALGMVDVGTVTVASALALPLFSVMLAVAFHGVLRSASATVAAVSIVQFSPLLQEFPVARATPFVLALVAIALRAAWGPKRWPHIRPDVVAVVAIVLAALDTPIVAGWLAVLWAVEPDPKRRTVYRAAMLPLTVGLAPLVLRGVVEHHAVQESAGSAREQLDALAGQAHVWMLLLGVSAGPLPRLRAVAAVAIALCLPSVLVVELRKVAMFYIPLFVLAGVAGLHARGWRWTRVLWPLLAAFTMWTSYSHYLVERGERFARIELVRALRAQIPERHPLQLWPEWMAHPVLVEAGVLSLAEVGHRPIPRQYAAPALPCQPRDAESWHLTLVQPGGEAPPPWADACSACERVPTPYAADLRRCPPR